MNLQFSIVLNETKFPELVHEKTDPGTRSADHLSQHLLRNIGDHSFGLAFLAKIGQQQENAGQSFFAGIEELIDKVFLNPEITRQQMVDKELREPRFLVKDTYHTFNGELYDCAVVSGRSARYPYP